MLQDTKVPQFLGFPPTTALPVPHCWGLAAVCPCLSFPTCQGMLRHRHCQLFVRWLAGWGGWWWWGWWSLRDPQPSHCPSHSHLIPTGVSGTKTPLVRI